MRYTTAGESHGPALTSVVTHVPAGIAFTEADADFELARRQMGYGRGGRMKIESDHARIISGVRFGKTLGTPVSMIIENRDHANWLDRMATGGERPEGLVLEQTPRPGHADLVGALKIDTDDCRDILERASARETASRVAAGALAKALLHELGVDVDSYVTRIGSAALPADFFDHNGYVIDNEIVDLFDTRCPDEDTSDAMRSAIDEAREQGQSLGGWFTVTATGLVPGVGGYAEASHRLSARLAAAVFSIPAIKGVEFGIGFEAGRLPGGEVHDPIALDRVQGYYRLSNNAGGLEGGMTTGEPLVMHACMKPIPTLTSPLDTVNIATGEPAKASRERSDVCAVPSAAVVAEAEVALVLATAYQRKFGGDCLADMQASLAAYRERIARR